MTVASIEPTKTTYKEDNQIQYPSAYADVFELEQAVLYVRPSIISMDDGLILLESMADEIVSIDETEGSICCVVNDAERVLKIQNHIVFEVISVEDLS